MNNVEKKMSSEDIDTERIIAEIEKNYRLTSNTTRRIERQLQYVEDKLNKVLELLKYREVELSEVKRLQKIKQLEQQLNELKKGVL